MRRIYETQKDRDNETEVKGSIERWSNATLFKTPKLQSWDFDAYRGSTRVAAIELKVRTNTREKYPLYMISKNKWDKLLAQSAACVVMLAVKWTNFLGYVIVREGFPLTTGKGGRYDRSDPMDTEDMVYIPTNLFKEIPYES